MNTIDFSMWFLYRVNIWLLVWISMIWWFAYYQNILNPANMPLYNLSNGSKEVRFQTMSHIWSQTFYDGVKKDIEIAKKDGFILFYEWVQPWSEENLKEFNEAIWIEFSPDLYKNFSKLYWVDHQRNPEFFWILNNEDYNIDLDINTIMSIYREKTWSTDIENTKRWEQQVADISRDVIDQLSNLSEKELAVMRYVNKSVLNFIIKNAGVRNKIVEISGNQDLFSVILDERDAHLAENILSSEASNIFVMYGMMHFDGVYRLLKEQDSKWEIKSIDEKQLIY